MPFDSAEAKRAAAEFAVDSFVRPDTCIGLGTGSTAFFAIVRVGERNARGEQIRAVATSLATETLCAEHGIPLQHLLDAPIDVAIDGADEVAADWSLTKGGGGALFREKAVALSAARFVVVVDGSKLVERLGAFATPIEVVPFATPWVTHEIARQYPTARLSVRERDGHPASTDNGNAILDCAFGPIEDPRALDAELKRIHGVVATGLFCGLTTDVIVGDAEGAHSLARPRA